MYQADAEEEKSETGDNCQEVPVEDNQPEVAEDDEYVQVNKTIGDEGITVDLQFIKVHTSN